jgi:tetratricopeptide (TPR) repeat protein
MAPLRELLLSSGLPARGAWATVGQNLTLGRRDVSPSDIRRRMSVEFERIIAHLAELYEAYLRAIEALDSEDPAEAVEHLLAAGQREEEVGRLPQAEPWYAVALGIAEGLQDRRPEIKTLLAIGRLNTWLAAYEQAVRHYRRALVLAESELDQPGVISACEGLGVLALEQGAWDEADAWYARGLGLAQEQEDNELIARLHHRSGELARRRGQFDAANSALQRARELFEKLGDARQMACTLITHGLLHADRPSPERAAGAYREALAWARKSEPCDDLEVFIRMNSAKLHLSAGRLLEAEEELRRAEAVAIRNNFILRLSELYVLLGRLRGEQGDDGGFVFLEQALQLARMLERSSLLEARVYAEYGAFKVRVRQPEDAQAYLRRAKELFASIGATVELERVTAELGKLTG